MSEGKRKNESGDGEEGENYLRMLQDQRLECEKEGRFMEAENFRAQIEDLESQQSQKQMENLCLKQHQDRLEIEEAHTKEYEDFQTEWEEKLRQKE